MQRTTNQRFIYNQPSVKKPGNNMLDGTERNKSACFFYFVLELEVRLASHLDPI